MAAVTTTVTIPVVGGKQAMVELLHKSMEFRVGNCDHGSVHGIPYKMCELLVSDLFYDHVVEEGSDFLRGLKDNPLVQDVIKRHMAEVWEEAAATKENPFKCAT